MNETKSVNQRGRGYLEAPKKGQNISKVKGEKDKN